MEGETKAFVHNSYQKKKQKAVRQNINHEEHLGNLLLFLSDEDIACSSVADLPANADALKTLKNSTIETTPNNPPEIHFSVNESYVAAWYLRAKSQWFIGYTKEQGGGENYLVEHLERVNKSSEMLWMMLIQFQQNKLFM